MATELGKKNADALWAQVCSLLEKIGWKYTIEEVPEGLDDYLLTLKMTGEDLPMNFYVGIDASRQVLYLKSPEFTQFSAEQIPTAAIAICAVNDALFDGSCQRGNVFLAICLTRTDSACETAERDRLIYELRLIQSDRHAVT